MRFLSENQKSSSGHVLWIRDWKYCAQAFSEAATLPPARQSARYGYLASIETINLPSFFKS
jgi:hypothetical protein